MVDSDAQKLQLILLNLVFSLEKATTTLQSQLDDILFNVLDVENVIKTLLAMKEKVQIDKLALLAKAEGYPERERLQADEASVDHYDRKPASHASTPDDVGFDYDDNYMYPASNRKTRTSV